MMTNMKYALTAALVAGGFALLGPATGVAQFKPGSTIVKGNLKGNVNFIDVYQKESYSKVVKRELSKNETYVITLTAKGFDPILRLETAKGVVLQTNDDGGPGLGLNSRITFNPPKTAEYRMVVTSLQPNKDGSFEVRIDRKVKRDKFQTKVTKFIGFGKFATDKVKKNKDGTITGIIPFRTYSFQLKGLPNGIYAYTLKVDTQNFKPTLTVLDAKNKEIAKGKASGKQGSRVSFVPPREGRYTIRIVGSGIPAAGGLYRLTIDEEITR